MMQAVYLWLLFCEFSTAFALGVIIGYWTKYGFHPADWRIYAAGLFSFMLGVINVVLFRRRSE